MKVLFTYDYGKEKMDAIRELGYTVSYINEASISNENIDKDIDILVCYNPFSKLNISKLQNLKWIQLSSIGIDQLPMKIVRDKNILVTNNKSGYSIPMGEWVVLKTLELLKNSKDLFKQQDEKLWKMDTSLMELFQKNVCFVGTGSIAMESAKRLQGFGVKISGINTSGKNAEYFDECHPIDDLKNVIGRADIVVLTIPYTKQTHHLIDNEVLDSFKSSSYLINVSRGSIINENHLVDALKNKKIKGAALDVFEQEPLKISSELWKMKNVIITPHNSWISELRNERRYRIVFENLKRYKNGEEVKNIVDVIKGY